MARAAMKPPIPAIDPTVSGCQRLPILDIALVRHDIVVERMRLVEIAVGMPHLECMTRRLQQMCGASSEFPAAILRDFANR
jgi:hypothetical protein